MHQELSRRDKVPALNIIFWILTVAFVLTLLNTILVRMHMNSALTDFLMIGIIAVGIYLLIKRNIVSYKYCIIEDELIVHEMVGTREKNVFSLNVSQILKFGKTEGKDYQTDKQGNYISKRRLYNCADKSNRHYIVFEEEGNLNWFTFQPSGKMVSMIKSKLRQ